MKLGAHSRLFLIILCLGTLLLISLNVKSSYAQTSVKTYYVDCSTAGNDTNNGTSESTPWKSLSKANTASLAPGDKLLFKKGCVWTSGTGQVAFTAGWNGTQTSPITIGAYGSGNNPIIRSDAQSVSTNQINIAVSGSYLTIENIKTSLINPFREPQCLQPDTSPVRLGWYVGMQITGHHNTVNHFEAELQSLALSLTDTAYSNTITDLYAHDLNVLWRLDRVNQAMGSLGVLLHGNDNEVGYSTFERNFTECNYVSDNNYQRYGAPFEIYNANRSYVHHNKAYEHFKHYEMGKDAAKTTEDNILAYNLFVSSRLNAIGVNIHGSTNPFGPVNRTQIYNNTMLFTGANSQGIVCDCDGGATIKNNIFAAESKAAYLSENFTETNNIYWDYQLTTDASIDPFVQIVSGTYQTVIDVSSKKVNPLLVNAVIPNGDYHLSATSPAVNSGVNVTLPSIPILDLDNKSVPAETTTDIGTYEFGATPLPTGSQTVWREPFADAYTSSSQISTNFGTAAELLINGTPSQITFFKFDLSEFAGKTIEQADLLLKVSRAGNELQTVKSVANTSWIESGVGSIVFANKPAIGQAITTFNGGALGDLLVIDLTSHLRTNSGNIISLAIDSTAVNGLGIYSREDVTSNNRPRIRVTYSGTTVNHIPGDINRDNVVDILDFTLLSNNFGTTDAGSDLNSDGIVNILDYTILNSNFGSSS